MGQAEFKRSHPLSEEEMQQDITQAIKEWDEANRMFQFAQTDEQIDYAIYSLIACEKKYSMLLKKAKIQHLDKKNSEATRSERGGER